MTEDIKITQESKASLKQVFGSIPENFKNSVVILMGNTLFFESSKDGGDGQKDDPFEVGATKRVTVVDEDIKKILLDLIKSLPNPKLKNLKRLAMQVLLEDMGTPKEVEKYLGLANGTIGRYVWRNKEQVKLEVL